MSIGDAENITNLMNLKGHMLYDADGGSWQVTVEERNRLWGMLGKEKVVGITPSLYDGRTILKNLLESVARKTIEEWVAKDAAENIVNATRNIASFMEECVSEGERQFRKKFMEKLGVQGAQMWRQILEEEFAHIYKILKNTGRGEIETVGVLPEGVRAHWQKRCKNGVYDLFCVEEPPSRRSIYFLDRYYRLAFPWMRFFLLFYDRLFWPSYFSAFYGDAKINSMNDALLLPNLGPFDNGFPYRWCLGSGMPNFQLNGESMNEIIGTHFWMREFVSDVPSLFWSYHETASRIPEVRTTAAWEEFSTKTPQDITRLPWRSSGATIGDFATRLMGYFCDVRRENESKINDDEKRALVTRFSERLEESLHFLGTNFAVTPSIEKLAKQRANASLQAAERGLLKSFAHPVEHIVSEVVSGMQWQEHREPHE